MNHTKTLMLLLALALVASAGLAANASDTQSVTLNVSEVAEITAGAGFTLTMGQTVTPGAVPPDETNSATNLQYTSVVSGAATRKITAQLGSSETAPAGTELRLTATNLAANEGTAGSQLTLSETAQDLITAIASINTGTDPSDGPQMDYVWTVTDITALKYGNNPAITVTFTLTDEV